MVNVFEVLRFACVILFTLSVPLLVFARFRSPEFPVWGLILFAIALGWIFPFSHKMLERSMHREFDREQRVAAEEYMRHPRPPIALRNADGSQETVVENPYGLGDWIAEDYHPVESLLYGPAYFVVCWAAAWVFFRRSPFKAGFLTYAQVNERLPLAMVDPKEIEEIVKELKTSGIRVVPDSPTAGT